jgi:hypothetical protein
MHGLTLWCEANKQEPNRCHDQEDLPDDREERDEGVSAEEEQVESRGENRAWRQRC